MAEMMSGLSRNEVIQKLVLSDNELKDDHGICVLNMIKNKVEKRDES